MGLTEIEKRIIDLLHQQNVKGISKYGKPLEQTDLQTVEVIEHAQQELIDLLQYLERIKQLLLNIERIEACRGNNYFYWQPRGEGTE